MQKEVNWEKWNEKENNFKKYESVESELIYGNFSKKVPDVSIMLITYKRADKLERALESAINQDYKQPYEIVVVDDSGYDEETDALMKKYCSKYKNIIYYRHKRNIGQYANWNRACELCRTQWYCLLHDDDMLKPNYLDEMMKIKKDDIGLIGTYFEVQDERITEGNEKKRLLDRFIELFLKLSHGKIINITLKDNIKHIFTFSCCLFINKNKAIEIGGLNDEYFPSSDFYFSSKMNYFYKTAFFTKKLSIRTISNNESLKQSVCDDSIVCAYNHTYHMCKELNYSDKKSKRKASIAAVISEIGVKGYNDVDYGNIKRSLGMSEIYNKKIVIFLINLYSKFNWGLLLFRRSI